MRYPSQSEIEELAAELNMSVGEDELEAYEQLFADRIDLLEELEQIPEPQLSPSQRKYTDRTLGYEPTEEEDPHNAWISKCRVEGADTGLLSGMTVGLKDNISLAGVPLTNGSEVMQGYVPTTDATIVTRLLDAGATIIGKNNMWAFSGGKSDYGPAENPAAEEYSIGGSSSGTAAAVAAGEADIGIGGDQGGSIRMPCACGGLVGLKPTYGLIPYTGIMGADPTIDYTGPITRTVEEAAIALTVLAGRDGLDQRQPHDLETQDYTGVLDKDISDMTIGVLKEGFEHDASDPEVNAVVHEAVADLEAMGATVTDVSVPAHYTIGSARKVVSRYGYGQQLLQNGAPIGANGWYDTHLIEYLGRALEARDSDLPFGVKSRPLFSEYIRRNYQGSVYGKAQNLIRTLREKYDKALTEADALVLPTLPTKPPMYGEATGMESRITEGRARQLSANTGPFNASKHPALTIQCGETEGAPVGMMFVGRRFDEESLLRLAYAYEQSKST
jgi:amidase